MDRLPVFLGRLDDVVVSHDIAVGRYDKSGTGDRARALLAEYVGIAAFKRNAHGLTAAEQVNVVCRGRRRADVRAGGRAGRADDGLARAAVCRRDLRGAVSDRVPGHEAAGQSADQCAHKAYARHSERAAALRLVRSLAGLLFLRSIVVRDLRRLVLRDELRVLVQPLFRPHVMVLAVVGQVVCSVVSVIVHDGLRMCSFELVIL